MKKTQTVLGVVFTLVILSVIVPAAPNSVDKVILASNSNYPDAVVSSAVSQKIGTPILLTDKEELSESTVSALDDLQPTEVIAVGGPAVVSDNVVQDLKDEGYEVTRLWGMSRYGTAEEIAGHFWPEGADKALLVENRLGEPNGNILGSARNLAEGSPVFPVPRGEIPANVLSQLEELGVSEVTFAGTENTEEMESELSSLGISIGEKIQDSDERKLQEKIQNRSFKNWEGNDTLVISAVENFNHVISASNLPQSQSFLVSSEDEIQEAVDVVEERKISKVKVVGKPDLAQKIAVALNNTDAEVDLVAKGGGDAVEQVAKMTRKNKPEFVQKFKQRHSQWQNKIQEAQGKMKTKANKTMIRAQNLIQERSNSKAEEALSRAEKSFENGNYQKALEEANEARRHVRKQKWNKVKGNFTAVREAVRQEVQSLKQKTEELRKINREFGERMSKNMSVEERLQVVKQFKGRRTEKVREVVETAIGIGSTEEIGNWMRKAEKQAGKGSSKGNGSAKNKSPK